MILPHFSSLLAGLIPRLPARIPWPARCKASGLRRQLYPPKRLGGQAVARFETGHQGALRDQRLDYVINVWRLGGRAGILSPQPPDVRMQRAIELELGY